MKKIITFIMIISLITGCSYFNKKEVEVEKSNKWDLVYYTVNSIFSGHLKSIAICYGKIH